MAIPEAAYLSVDDGETSKPIPTQIKLHIRIADFFLLPPTMSHLYARKYSGGRHAEPIWDDRKHSKATWRICGQLTNNRRRTSFLLLIAILAAIVLVFRWPEFTAPTVPDTSFPPSWEKLQQWERDLPQHNLELPYPEGKNGRYVKFDNQIRMLGWNNVFNEVYASLPLLSFDADP